MAAGLFVDISSHGRGHLAQVAPILNLLGCLLPDLRLTIRSGLSTEILQARLHNAFTHIRESSDFGFVMLDAVRIDRAGTAAAYQEQHANWEQRVSDEAGRLDHLRPDLVLSDVAYLPLAGAARAGIPSVAMCSLNWAELFIYYFGGESWAGRIHQEILSAYCCADKFLRLTPAMPMIDLPNLHDIGPVAALGRDCRSHLRKRLACQPGDRLVLIAFGGFDIRLPIELWPRIEGVRWLVPQSWGLDHDDKTALESLDMQFTDLICSVDAVFTKPGYGIFAEAACNGIPVLYLRRDDWPEQDCLIDWLKRNARCREIDEAGLVSQRLQAVLIELWKQSKPSVPIPVGAEDAARVIAKFLEPRNLS